MNIHPSSIVGPNVEIASGVEIGPYSVIQGKVKIGKNCKIAHNVSIGYEVGSVNIGENNQFSPGCVIGYPPQDHTFNGENTQVSIGNNNIIREFVTINLGTVKGGGVTSIGNDNLLMSYVHIGHDSTIKNNIDFASMSGLSGHCLVEDHVKIGGQCGISQFTRIGKFAFIGGASSINKDILPFTIANGNWALSRATNKVGLKRCGYKEEDVAAIDKALRYFFRGHDTVEDCIAQIRDDMKKANKQNPEILYLIEFITSSKRGIAR